MFWSSRYTLLYMVGAGTKPTVARFIPEHSRKGTNANPKCRILASGTHGWWTSQPQQLLGVPLFPATCSTFL